MSALSGEVEFSFYTTLYFIDEATNHFGGTNNYCKVTVKIRTIPSRAHTSTKAADSAEFLLLDKLQVRCSLNPNHIVTWCGLPTSSGLNWFLVWPVCHLPPNFVKVGWVVFASDIIVDAPPDVTILGHIRSMWLIPSSISVHRLMPVGETILIFVEESSWPVHAWNR